MNWHTRSCLCSSHQPQAAALTKVCNSRYSRHIILTVSVLERVVVPDALVKELATLRFGFAKLLRNYEKQLQRSPEAQEEFVEFLPRLFPNVTSSSEQSSFQSAFNKCVEEEVSLFNTHYLKRICDIFPEDIW